MDSVDVLRCVWLVLVTGSAYAAVIIRRVLLGQKHPLDWPVDLEMMAAGFKVSLRWGNLATLRLMLSFMAHPALFFGLKVDKVQPPGCEPCYWLSLKSQGSSSSWDDSSSTRGPKQPDIVLCYVHGGAFVAGHPLMCSATFERWMKALARQGLTTKVLCISYPLAPERPFPAAVASTAAVFAWVGQRIPAGCGTTVIAVGDSAGGNIVPTSLAALRDYCQHRHPHRSAQILQQGSHPPAAGFLSAAAQATVVQSSNGNSSAGGHAGSAAAPAPAGETEHAAVAADAGSYQSVSHMASDLIRSDSQAASLTAALEAHLFADLHNRLTVMTAVANSRTTSTSSVGAGAGAVTVCRTVRMPSAVILVSPAADISPTASFRTRKAVPPSTSNPTDTTSGASTVYAAGKTHAAGLAAPESTSSTGGSSSGSGKVHWDYLPENIESGGMGSYAEHHEQLCGVYASPVHLPRVDGLCNGRWLVLAGGVELLYPDIERFAQKLQQALGPDRALFHVEPRLPHSWAILPNPSMATRQEVVIRFIAAEHAAAVAATETPAVPYAAAAQVLG